MNRETFLLVFCCHQNYGSPEATLDAAKRQWDAVRQETRSDREAAAKAAREASDRHMKWYKNFYSAPL